MLNKKYLIVKKKDEKAITYFEYDKIQGYNLSPKKGLKIEDAIDVNKIVIINPSLANKVAKKKFDLKLKKFLKLLNVIFETDDETGTTYMEALNELSKLRTELLNKYKKHLEQEEYELTEKKLGIIEHELKIRLFYIEKHKEYSDEFEIGKRSR